MGDYISPWMTEELSLLRDSVAKFYAKELVPHEDRWHKAGIIDREAWNKAGEFGVLGASVPEEYGGGGGTFAHEAVIYEEQAYANALALNRDARRVCRSWPFGQDATVRALQGERWRDRRRWR